jgi:aspartyl-tRNA(Asn)/glutamyl-tRNA(Gln) amidotransferase subunit C
MKARLTDEDVKKVAKLAMIELTPDEIEKFKDQIDSILDYVQKLNEIDTDNVKVTSHVDLKNITREDESSKSLDQNEAVKQADNKDGYIVVPAVITNE